jgi:hypothetical protein
MKKINIGFTNYSEAALEVKAQAIVAAMTDNVFFPPPVPELTAMAAATTAYAASLSAAKNGGKTEVAIKNQKRAELTDALIVLANFVTLKANGEETILVSSGFDLSKEKAPSPPLAKPEIIKVADGVNAGELQVAISKVPGARLYMYQYTQDPLTAANQWQGQSTTLSKASFQNLESGKKYWCRVVAYGVNEQVVFSDPVARIVQ